LLLSFTVKVRVRSRGEDLEAAHKGKTLWALSKFLRAHSFKTDKGHDE
jgi:hypothetical protein